MRALALAALLFLPGCDKVAPPPVPETATVTVTPPEVPARPPAPPPAVQPAKPDFEDAPGTVVNREGVWMIEVDSAKPICLPFEAPADVREDGAEVRFTLYLDGSVRGCRGVGTLVSMRLN